MLQVIILVAIIHTSYTLHATVQKYCKLSETHTVCETNCERSYKCLDTSDGFTTFTDKEREMLLHKHNQIRNEVAEGKWEGHHLPKAANMQVLSYDKELELIMGCWLKQCKWGHDKARNKLDGTAVGQNLFKKIYPFHVKYKMDKAFWDAGIQLFFDEYKKLTPGIVSTFFTEGKFRKQRDTERLTQLLWGSTKYIGCAKMHYRTQEKHIYYGGCNYASSGNIKGGILYTKGESACTVKNDKYPSLCGKIRPLSEDKYEAPFNIDDEVNGAQIIKPCLFLILFVLTCILLF